MENRECEEESHILPSGNHHCKDNPIANGNNGMAPHSLSSPLPFMLSSTIEMIGRMVRYSPLHWKRAFSVLRVGVDEAGRGAVLGPLVISAVLLDKADEELLKSHGVRDSKQMTPQKRFQTYDLILEKAIRSYSVHMSSLSIDKKRKMGLSMNRIEENHIFDLLRRFQDAEVDAVIIDAFVSKNNRLQTEASRLFPNIDVLCEHHADDTYPCVAAASVIAKVTDCFCDEE